MARRRQGELVENEQRIAVAALGIHNHWVCEVGSVDARFWAKDIQAELARIEPGSSMNDSTVNRALRRLVTMGWLAASWETHDPADPLSSKPRLYFRFTDAGLRSARGLVRLRRRATPLWVLFPLEAVGEPPNDDRLPMAGRILPRSGSGPLPLPESTLPETRYARGVET